MVEESLIVDDIEKTEHLLREQYNRLSDLEHQLRQRKLPKPEEETAKKELEDIKTTLKGHEDTLKNLRNENRKSLAMVIVFVAIFLSLYALFTLMRQMGWL